MIIAIMIIVIIMSEGSVGQVNGNYQVGFGQVRLNQLGEVNLDLGWVQFWKPRSRRDPHTKGVPKIRQREDIQPSTPVPNLAQPSITHKYPVFCPIVEIINIYVLGARIIRRHRHDCASGVVLQLAWQSAGLTSGKTWVQFPVRKEKVYFTISSQ